MRNVSVQRCNIRRQKQDFRWNCLNACEFIDEFCCVLDVAWNKLHQSLEIESMKPDMFSVNVPILDAIGLPGGKFLRSFAKVIMSLMS